MNSDPIQPLDRARRRLSEAVWLYFESRDPLVVETLAEEARADLHELMERSPVEVRRGFLESYLLPEHHGAAEGFLRAEGEGAALEGLLFDALTAYLHLSQEWIIEAAAFFSWMQLEKREWFRPEVLSTQGLEARRGERAFFLAFLQEAEQNGPDENGARTGRHTGE